MFKKDDCINFALNKYWDYSIPTNVTEFAKNVGVEIRQVKNLEEFEYKETRKEYFGKENEIKKSILTKLINKNNRYIILTNIEEQNVITKRFAIAHSLGHYVLFHQTPLFDNLSSYNFNNSQIEMDANDFAMNLLMPENAVNFIIKEKNITDIEAIANIFKVSKYLVEKRLKQLSWI